MPRRPIPATGEMLPIIGLGSSKVVSEVSENGTEPLAAVLQSVASPRRQRHRHLAPGRDR